jgi:creatinine amidohydrolase
VYVYQPSGDSPGRPALKSTTDGHAGETETSWLMVARPDLLHMDRATSESGADLNRLDLPAGLYTGIWWYAKFPNHYAGDGSLATKELGEFDMKHWSDGIANCIRAVKADQKTLQLQTEFFEKAKHPLETKQ